MIIAVVVTAIVSLFWTPFDPQRVDIADRWAAPGWPHVLGTDGSGRDILSLIMAGARTTVLVAIGAGIVATVIGVALAALGALTARWMRESVAVFVDILIAFPVLIIAMMISAVWGGSLWVVIWSVGIGFGVNIARVTRPELRRVLHSDFVLAGRASGLTPAQNLLRHLLPNVAPVFIVQLSWSMAVAVLAEAGLSYLGFGAPVTEPSWGRSPGRGAAVHHRPPPDGGLAGPRDHGHRAGAQPARRRAARGDRPDTLARQGPAASAPRLDPPRAGGRRVSLEVQDLTVDIDGRRVVDGVSFEVPDGARVGLIGESGSGKSLTALAILGLLPDGASAGGSVRWNGRELIGLADRELAAASRRRDRHRVPGAAHGPQSDPHGRPPDRRVHPHPREGIETGCCRPRRRGGGPCRAARSGAHREPLPASALGRPAPARRDRHGARVPTAAADRG